MSNKLSLDVSVLAFLWALNNSQVFIELHKKTLFKGWLMLDTRCQKKALTCLPTRSKAAALEGDRLMYFRIRCSINKNGG